MRNPTPLLPWLIALSSCSSPPKPPSVDESQKRPVNSQIAVELQVCRNDLQNTRLLATESGRVAELTAATLANVTARQQMLTAMQGPTAPPAPNSIYTIRFGYGSTRVAIPADIATALIQEAQTAPLIQLSGRTDGTSDTPAEAHIARSRAAAVRNYLVTAGVDPVRIRTTYQPTGDHVADNASASGRGLNRRVEIELYHALPVTRSATTVAQP